MKSSKYVWKVAAFLLTFGIGVGIVWTFFVVSNDKTFKYPSRKEGIVSNVLSTEDDDYAVFSAILTYLDLGEQIVVSEYAIDEHWEYPPDGLPHKNLISQELLYDYIRKNLIVRKLENKFTVSGKVLLLNQQEEETLFPKASDNIIYFSNVGFNSEKTEALVLVARNCRGRKHFLLKKTNGIWTVITSSSEFTS